MASTTDICNIALSHIGARAQITSISPPDGSVEAGYCARFFPIARKELLETPGWSFARTRVALSEVANDSTVWLYAYALPADCIKPLRVLTLAQATVFADEGVETPLSESTSADYEVEGQVLRTDEPEAVLLYVQDVTDTTKYTPLFTSALGMMLAAYLAGPIIKGLDGAKAGAQWRQSAFAMLAKAAANDANRSAERAEHVAAHLRARA